MFASKLAPAVGSAAALVLVAGAANAQYAISGSACAGESGEFAGIQGVGFPTSGQTMTIEVSGLANTATILGFGTTPIPPFDLTGVGLPGCTLDVLITTSIPNVTDGNGVATYAAPTPGAVGATFYLQGYVADLGITTLGATSEQLSVTVLPPSTLSGGEVIVTEFLRDPSTISDSNGEWLELHNTTTGAIDIEGWTLADDDFDFHTIDNGGLGVVIPAGGYIVCGPNADPLVAGYAFDYVWSGFFLSNSTSSGGDEIVLYDGSGFEVDRVNYNLPAGWPLQGAASASLDPGSTDGTSNDDPLNWCLNTTDVYETVAGVNTGTPGAANPVCTGGPSTEQGDIIITEFMQNPSALGDGDGEYFEVYNTTGSPIDMMGWTISDLGSDSFVVGSSVIVPAGGYATFSNGAAPGFTPDYSYGGSMFLANGDDELVLTDGGGQLQDQILWDNGATFPDGNGASANFSAGATQDATTNNDGLNWCESTAADAGYTSGDFGSPGVANETCP